MLASTSKVPAVMAIMALDEDESVDFSISEPVSTYLPFDGVYADHAVEQMVSNTSGIPGLRLLDGYGSPTGPTLQDFNHLCQFSAQPFMNFEMCDRCLSKMSFPRQILRGRSLTTVVVSGDRWADCVNRQ